MIPENKLAIVEKALEQAFGTDKYDNIVQLTKGLSPSWTFKITVRKKPYLLRVITRTDGREDPAYYYSCMQAAATAGFAPRIHYLDVEDGISITDFITEKPFPVSKARTMMADTLRQLHKMPKFPFRINFIDVSDSYLEKFRGANILPEHDTKELFALYQRVGEVYPRSDKENWVSCHNDVKPDNIIFDGVRPLLIDWESAFLNDRYVDLAAIANFVVKDERDEAEFLESYFGGTVDDYKKARFFLMCQIVHMFCFTLCMVIGCGGRSVNTKTLTNIGFNEFHNRLWNCEISLADNKSKLQYAFVHLNKLLLNMQSERFDESLRIVAGVSKSR